MAAKSTYTCKVFAGLEGKSAVEMFVVQAVEMPDSGGSIADSHLMLSHLFLSDPAEPQLALRVPCFHCRLQPAGVEATDDSRGVSGSQVMFTFSAGLGAEEAWVESGMIQYMKGTCRCSDTNSLIGVAEAVFFMTFLFR